MTRLHPDTSTTQTAPAPTPESEPPIESIESKEAKRESAPEKKVVQPVPSAKPTPKADAWYIVQVGAFNTREKAKTLVNEIKAARISATIYVFHDQQQQLWYGVMIGKYKTRQQAIDASKKFQATEKMPAIIKYIYL